MSFKRFALILGLLLGGVGFAEGFDATVATPGVLKLKVTVLDRETEQPLPYVKMGFNFNNGTVRIVRAIDMRTGADGVATREVPYDSAGNIVLDGAAYAHQHPEISWANKSFNLVANKGQTIDIDPVDAADWNWNTAPYNGEYRVRRVVPGEGQYMRILDQTSHDNATLANVFSVQTGATLHFKCWLQRPASAGAHTVTYETSLVSNAGDFAQETVADGGMVTRTATTPANAIWTASTFTGWTVDGVPFGSASRILFNLNLEPHWEGAEGEAFTLDTSRPVAGEEMTAVPAEGLGTGGTFVYRWTRGNTGRGYEANPVSTTESYTPQTTDYEHWFKFEMSMQLNGRNYPLGSKEFFFSKLPVLYMTTNDGGDPTPAKEDHDGHLVVQGGRDFDTALDIDFSIHVRGNSSTQYPKLPYKIKLDKKKEMFGIPENKHWILVSNYLDPSLVRDKIAYDFAAMIGSKPAVRSTWVDCVLNGRWIGCYLFCEHLRVGKDRVDVYDWEGAAEDCAKALLKAYPALSEALEGDQGPLEDQMKQDFNWVTSGTVNYAGRDWAINTTVWKKYSQNITGGYFFELSEEFDSISKWRVDLGGDFKLKMMVNAPEYLASNTAMMDYCKDYWNQYWNAVRSPNGYSGGKHWKELCKLNSMVTYWLTMEIFGNDDSRQKSRFAYKDVDEKLYFGPVWDFDWGMGGAPLRSGPDGHLTPFEPTGWKVTKGGVQWQDDQGDRAFYREWIDDPLFCTRAYEKYHEFRAAMMDIVAEGGVLSQHVAYLAEAGGTNSVKWLYKGQTFSQDVADLRVYLANRFAWLDKQFASVGTLMTSLRDAIGSHSASPYVPDSATLPVAFLETRGALGSPETSVLHVWHEKEEDLEVSFKIGAGASQVASVETYVNGLIVGEGVPVTAGQTLNVTIPHDMMDAKPEQRDVVQFVARNANGGVVARNFALVSPMGEVPDDPIARYCWDLVPGTLKVAMKVMNKAGTEPLKNFTMQLNLKPTGRDRVPVAVGTTDEEGYLFIELPYDGNGNIIQNGVTSTISLTNVETIDCDPVLSTYSWSPLTPGFVRNFPTGYSQYVNRVLTGQGWDNAVVNTADSDGDRVLDYIAAGASLYFECYISDNTGSAEHTVTFDTTGMTPESAALYGTRGVAHNGTYTFPQTAPEDSSGRAFLGWRMTVAGTSLPGITTDLAEGTESFTVAQNLTLTPIWGGDPNVQGIIRFRVHLWDHAGYWSNGGDVSAGRTMTPVNGLTFVLKSYPGDLQGGVPDSQKVPVGRPNTAEGWEQSRVEAKYLGHDDRGLEIWEATYVISNDQLQYLTPGHVIDTDPDEHDLATVNRGFGEEEVTFDWDWYYVGDDHVGAGLTGVREIPEGHSGNVMIGRNANDVAVITQEMIANGFEFTFNCWVVPALVVKFDTDNGLLNADPTLYPEQRCPPINSLSLIESQQFYAQNPGSPTRGADESFVGWYEVSTDEDGNPVLASEPWNFGTAVTHSMTLKAVYRQQLGVALMIVDHDDADAENVYLAFKPQFATGVDQQAQQTWLTGIVNGTQDVWVKTAPQRAGVGAATPVKAVASTKHTSTIEKVWVKVPLSSTNEAGGFSQIVLDGEPIAYTCADGTTIEATGSQGATSVNTFGYLRVATNTVNTMVSVPWTWYSDKGTPALPADKLVRTTNLSEGDQLYAYAGASNYLAWVVNANKQWEAIDTLTVGDDQVGSNAKLVPNGNTTTLPHGTGVWLVRNHPFVVVNNVTNAVPFWLYGQSVANEVTTTITPMGEGETAHSTMLGNPYAQAMCISNLVFTGTVEGMKNDTIIIPNGTGSPMYLEYRNKGTKREPSTENGWVWVSLDTSVSPPKNAYNWEVMIPPGSAFWYVRRNAAPLSVTWKLPKVQEPSEE